MCDCLSTSNSGPLVGSAFISPPLSALACAISFADGFVWIAGLAFFTEYTLPVFLFFTIVSSPKLTGSLTNALSKAFSALSTKS